MARTRKPTSKYSREGITELLLTNDRAVCRALVVLFNNQTAFEKRVNTTNLHNDIGFTSSDAHWGCINAKTFLATGHLSAYSISLWRKPNVRGVPRIAKYWRQLIAAAEARDARDTHQMRFVA